MPTTPILWKDLTQINMSDGGAIQVAPLQNGGYVVVWADKSDVHNPDGPAIVGQVYNAFGEKVGGEALLSRYDDPLHLRRAGRPGIGIWFGAVLRGGNEHIRVGLDTNIQEHCVLHASPGFPLSVGRGCTIGHRAILHGCTVGDNTLIGMGAVVLDGASIGRNCLIGAGALIPGGQGDPTGLTGTRHAGKGCARAFRGRDRPQPPLLSAVCRELEAVQ